MSEHLRRVSRVLLWGLLAAAWPAWAQLVIPGADGSDGVFAPTENVQIDLSQAPTGSWDSPGSGNGVYDPDKWAVVFKYSSVDIPAGVTVTFKNHDSRAPVVWLVSGDASIAGVLRLDGENWQQSRFSEPGPGGFPGGIGHRLHSTRSGGFGIGGGGALHSGGNHATAGANNGFPTYGNPRLLPLVGGSGGGGDADQDIGGGAGGGALLLAVAGSLTIDGVITAHGGAGREHSTQHSGSGAGGAIRLIAGTIAGSGVVAALGRSPYDGGDGRIRIEALNTTASWDILPATSIVAPDDPVLLWPPAGAPSVRVVSVAGGDVPPDPRARFEPGREDVNVGLSAEGRIVLATANVDPAATVRVRITPENGAPFFVDAVLDSGTVDAATWLATTDNLPEGYFTVQAHGVNPAP